MPKIKDISGVRSDMLIALSFNGFSQDLPPRHAMWLCRCDCGETCIKAGYQITARMIKSCGCLMTVGNTRNTKHGHTGRNGPSREYNSWAAMKNRCKNKSHKDWPLYGGRGIRVCDRWANGENGQSGFECFLSDMGKRPAGMTLDRYPEIDGDYMPGNVRWASSDEQASNRSISVTIDGKTLRQIAEEHGLTYGLVHGRYYNGSHTVSSLTAPPNPNQLWTNNGRRDVVDRRTGEIVS